MTSLLTSCIVSSLCSVLGGSLSGYVCAVSMDAEPSYTLNGSNKSYLNCVVLYWRITYNYYSTSQLVFVSISNPKLIIVNQCCFIIYTIALIRPSGLSHYWVNISHVALVHVSQLHNLNRYIILSWQHYSYTHTPSAYKVVNRRARTTYIHAPNYSVCDSCTYVLHVLNNCCTFRMPCIILYSRSHLVYTSRSSPN